MLWVIEMQSGTVFEAETKRKLVNQIVSHYAQRDQEASQIKSLFYLFKDNRCNEICNNGVARLQDLIDQEVAEWRRIANEEYRGQQEIESEVRGLIYG